LKKLRAYLLLLTLVVLETFCIVTTTHLEVNPYSEEVAVASLWIATAAVVVVVAAIAAAVVVAAVVAKKMPLTAQAAVAVVAVVVVAVAVVVVAKKTKNGAQESHSRQEKSTVRVKMRATRVL
jgi:membrane protein YdbS with pleckstrin-like domain